MDACESTKVSFRDRPKFLTGQNLLIYSNIITTVVQYGLLIIKG